MPDITLTASAQNSLLSLTRTASLMSRTTGRLTSGLKVASAIDDAVSYFKSKGLTDRAADFANRKDEIDQGISGLKAAVNGTALVDAILKQLKGIVNSVRTSDATTRDALGSQFNDLVKQINMTVRDASYQGLNLIDNSSASMTVYFSQGTAAALNVKAKNLMASKLLTQTIYPIMTGGDVPVWDQMLAAGVGSIGFSVLTSQTTLSPARILDKVSSNLDRGISRIRSQTALLGGNVTFLQSRMDFTTNYINTLQEGSGKLTLADLNEEGANLVSLQTRQQIGVQSLSISGQQQQAILSLLR
ncbi:MAG: flagellin [Rhodospirillaceae bacterium]